jgi:hypothetical protein
VDCHMPLLVKSAVSHPAVNGGPPDGGPVTGDISSHLFNIQLDSDAEQFTEDNLWSFPWITGDWACRTCHNGVDQQSLSDEFLDGYEFHNNVQDDT